MCHHQPTLTQALENLRAVCRRCRDAAARAIDCALRTIGGRDLRRLPDAEDHLQTIMRRLLESPPGLRATSGDDRAAWVYLRRAWYRGLVDAGRRARRWLSDPLAYEALAAPDGGPGLVEEREVFERAFEDLRRGPSSAVDACSGAGREGFRRALRSRLERVIAEVRGDRTATDLKDGAVARAERRAVEHLAAVYDDPADPDPVARRIHQLVPYLRDLRTWAA
jgi:hypothetical protein